MNRRNFLKNITGFLAGIIGVDWLPFKRLPQAFASQKIFKQSLLAASNHKINIGELFDGEELIYNIGFWLFKKAAIGKIGLKRKEDGGYIAVLQAETLGVIGWVTRYRKDVYIAHMEEAEGGKRFITSVFDKTVIIGDTTKRTATYLDYKKRIMVWKKWKGDKLEEDKQEEIPPDNIYDDPLAAFYNFRFGTYGNIEEGREYRITTFPKKDVKTMYVRVATKDEKNQRIHSDPDDVDYLADIIIDKELFGSQTGKIEAFFTKELIPMGGIVKDMIFFGDVTGTLVEMTSKAGFRRDTGL